MRKHYLLSTLVLTILVSTIHAQDFSNKGKDFWVAYGYHQQMTNVPPTGGSQDMILYFAAEQSTNVTVDIPGIGWTASYFVPANTTIASATIPKVPGQDARLLQESTSPENKGIHITADRPIIAYAHIYNASVSGATILYPTNTLGKEYYSINFTNNSNSPNSNCWFYVIASDTGTTTIEITPSANTINHVQGVPFQVTLTQGQVFNIMGQYFNPGTGVDLTGSKIQSINTGSGCKKIAVFSGSGRIAIACNTATPSSDNYMTQALPKAAWGKKYLTTPIVAYNTPNGGTFSASTVTFYRVCVADPLTVVRINGAVTALPLINNFYYQVAATTQPLLIEGDQPITVAQYFPSQGNGGATGCGTSNGDGDPEVIYLSPVEQSIAKVIWNANARFQINTNKHYINVVIPNGGTAISSFMLDGVVVPSTSFTIHPQDAGYSYARINVTSQQGNPTANVGLSHIVQSDSGFNAIAYGYGGAESYGYNAGTNIKDLFQFINVKNSHGTVNFPATCKNTPFRLSMVFPYQPIQIDWVFGPLLNAMGFNDTTIYNGGAPIVADSSWVVAGRTLYRYRLPRTYTIPVVGVYPIKVIATNPTPDNCGSTQLIDFDLNVFANPIADFTFTTNGCFNSPVSFFDNSNTAGRPVISRYWDFGDASNSTIFNPIHTYAAPGVYDVKYSLITDVGCLADTTIHQVILDPPPTAAFTSSTPSCDGGTINFTDNSTSAGVINRWTWDFGDPASGANNTSVLQNPSHVFSGPGTYNVTLQVETTTGCQSLLTTIVVIIHPNPVPDFTLPGVCLPTGFAQFNDLSTIPPGESIIGWNWDFGDGSPNSNLQNPTHNYAGTGPYSVTLTTTSSNGCVASITKLLTTIYAEPQAAFTGPTDVCLGNAANFTDNSTAPASSVTVWDWNFGDGSPNSNLQNPSHIYAAAGIYTVTLNVTSAAGCQTVNNFATRQVEVHPLPTGAIAGNITVCMNAPQPNITFTGANGIPPYTFSYTINGGPVQTVTTVSGSSVTVAAPTNVAGTFVYALTGVQEGSGVACSQPQSGSITVVVNQLPTATVNGTITVCQNAPQPNITFTGATGTAPYTFTYNINGGPNQTISSGASSSITVAVPTNVPGTYVYNLLNVQESGPQSCQQAQTGSATVIVNNLPTASIAGTTQVCLNSPTPSITFTGAGTTAPYTFTYTINGGPNQNVSTVAGNSITIPVSTAVSGTFVYTLVSVSDGTPQTCSQTQAGSATVIVHPLPTSNFTHTAPTCETRSISFTDGSAPNAGTIITWAWDFGDPASGPNNISSLQNPTHFFSTAGTYNVTLVVTTNNGCVSTQPSRQVIVSLRPLAGFIIPEVCLSDTYAQFTDTSKVTAPDFITGWNWNFGDPPSGPNNTSVLQNPQHSYSATGSYNVELIATSNNGCKDTIVQVLFVNGSFPTANFNVQNPTTLCANDSVSIVEVSTVFPGVITKIEIYWDNVNFPAVFDIDNAPFTGKVYKHLYPNFQAPLTSTFTIRYRAYSGGVCVNDKIQTITVNAAPKITFPSIPNICYDAAPYQVPTPVNGGVPGSGVFSGNGVSPTGLFNPVSAGPGTHTIKYFYTSSTGGCVDSATQTIKVYQPAIANFISSVPACEKQAVTFYDNSNSTEGTITQWQWDFADGSPVVIQPSGAPFNHTFTTYGTFNVKLNVVTSNGCISAPQTLPVIVKPIARPKFTFPAISCLPNANVTFNNQSTIPDGTESAFTYLWNFGDPGSGPVNISTAANPSHTYAGTGPFTVNLQVTSGAGCVHDTSIVLNTIHPQPIASFTTDKTDVCIGGSVTFTSTSNPMDGTATQWNWDMDDGNVRTVPSFTYTYATAGIYNISLYIFNSYNCKSTVATKTISINPYPPVNAGPDKLMLEGGQVRLTPAMNAGLPVTYSWMPPDHLSNPNIVDPIARPPFDWTYTLTVTTDKGCSKSDDVFVKVLKKPDIPNIFSPNGDGIHDTWVIKYLDSYPGCTVDIVNRYGQLVFHSLGYTKPWDGKVNGAEAPVGTYYYVVDPKNGRAKITGYVDIIR